MKKKGIIFFILMAICAPNLYGNEIDDINLKINMLSKEIDGIKNELILIQDNVSLFDLTTETKIDKINTNAGPLFIKVDKVLPSEDGYSVKLYIGNPLAATLSKMTLRVAWYSSSNEWVKKDFPVSEQLKTSTWTPVNILLSPIDSLCTGQKMISNDFTGHNLLVVNA